MGISMPIPMVKEAESEKHGEDGIGVAMAEQKEPGDGSAALVLATMASLATFIYFMVDFLNGGNDPKWHELLWVPAAVFAATFVGLAILFAWSTAQQKQQGSSGEADERPTPLAKAALLYAATRQMGDDELRFTHQIGSLTFERGRGIGAVQLPEATGGSDPIRYSLDPSVDVLVPGLRFSDTQRLLTGSPERAGTYGVRYMAMDRARKSVSQQIVISVTGR